MPHINEASGPIGTPPKNYLFDAILGQLSTIQREAKDIEDKVERVAKEIEGFKSDSLEGKSIKETRFESGGTPDENLKENVQSFWKGFWG